MRPPGLEAAVHGVGALRLDPIDPASRIDLLDRRGDAAAQAATAHRHHHRIQPGHLAHQLKPNRCRALRDQRAVVRVHHGAALVGHQLQRVVKSSMDIRQQQHLGTRLTAGRHACRAGGGRHGQLGADAGHLSRVGHRHGMVAGAGRYHAARPRGCIHALDAVERATHLEGAGDLEQLQLEPDFRAGIELLGRTGLPAPHGRLQHLALQAPRGVLDFGQQGIACMRTQVGKIGHRVFSIESVGRVQAPMAVHGKEGPRATEHQPKPQLSDPG